MQRARAPHRSESSLPPMPGYGPAVCGARGWSLGMSVQSAEAIPERHTDIATTIALTMRQMGVSGLPRNYEIFYEALSGANPELSMELVSLGKRPRQEELDRIGRKFFAQNHEHGIVDNARDTVA